MRKPWREMNEEEREKQRIASLKFARRNPIMAAIRRDKWRAKLNAILASDPDAYAEHRRRDREYYATHRKGERKPYKPMPQLRRPDWCVKGQDITDYRSKFIRENLSSDEMMSVKSFMFEVAQ